VTSLRKLLGLHEGRCTDLVGSVNESVVQARDARLEAQWRAQRASLSECKKEEAQRLDVSVNRTR